MAVPKAPPGLKTAGQRLWEDVQAHYQLEVHEEQLLLQMARTADDLDALQAIVDREGVLDPATGRAHPALTESRQLRIAYARLSASLRLPSGDEGDQQVGARRPQRRVGVRQPYRLRGVAG